MQAAHSAAMAAASAQGDELSEELRWDFLRDLVEEEFAKLQVQAQPAAQAQAKPDCAASHEALSGMSTAYSSPAARPMQSWQAHAKASPGHVPIVSVSPMVSPLGGPVQYTGAEVPSMPAVPQAAMTPKVVPVFRPAQQPSHARFTLCAEDPFPGHVAPAWSINC